MDNIALIGESFETVDAVGFSDSTIIDSTEWEVLIEDVDDIVIDGSTSCTGAIEDRVDCLS